MSKPPSPHAIERAMSAAMRLREELRDDPDGYRLSLASETNVYEQLDRIIEQSVLDGLAIERAKRIKVRYDKLRDVAARMIDALGLTEPLERAVYTASLEYHRHVVITGTVPDEYIRDVPDKKLIGKDLRDGKAIEGASLSNPQPSLTVRTK